MTDLYIKKGTTRSVALMMSRSISNTSVTTHARILRTPRLILIPFDNTNHAHHDHYLACINNSHSIASMGDFGIYTRDQHRALITATILPIHLFHGPQVPPSGPTAYVIYLRDFLCDKGASEEDSETLGPPIGGITLAYRSPTVAPDMGWVVLPAWHRQGFATEAGIECLRYWRDEIGIKEIVAWPRESNAGSVKTALKIGFVEAGMVMNTEEGKMTTAYALPGMRRFEGEELGFWPKGVKEKVSTQGGV